MWRSWRRWRDTGFITASEMTSYAYCPEQWRLERVLRLNPTNRAALKAGTRPHARKAAVERLAGGAISLGRLVIAAALVVFLRLLWRVEGDWIAAPAVLTLLLGLVMILGGWGLRRRHG